ncbi:hypothetical protein SSP531S_12530 [Streptomyces spongiicola]|uniref:Uncharacterized protein n=1 Tax=Streptomyces spongiicola TaxID=1690221 RepID=A0A388STD1_9ACTN|nr:hypothetical protein SSP531S_12530 [Streptomyces spongiicola]
MPAVPLPGGFVHRVGSSIGWTGPAATASACGLLGVRPRAPRPVFAHQAPLIGPPASAATRQAGPGRGGWSSGSAEGAPKGAERGGPGARGAAAAPPHRAGRQMASGLVPIIPAIRSGATARE